MTNAELAPGPAPATAIEKRLALRMLALWQQVRRNDLPPRAGSLEVADTGADADHVFMIDLRAAGGPCFTHVGEALRPAAAGTALADCPPDSILAAASHNWHEIIERGVPVTRGGSGYHDGDPVLYRSIMMPLVDEGGAIALLMGAVNWRVVEERRDTGVA